MVDHEGPTANLAISGRSKASSTIVWKRRYRPMMPSDGPAFMTETREESNASIFAAAGSAAMATPGPTVRSNRRNREAKCDFMWNSGGLLSGQNGHHKPGRQPEDGGEP